MPAPLRRRGSRLTQSAFLSVLSSAEAWSERSSLGATLALASTSIAARTCRHMRRSSSQMTTASSIVRARGGRPVSLALPGEGAEPLYRLRGLPGAAGQALRHPP